MIVEAEDGRLYIPKAVRDRVGARFELIEREDRVILVPLPADPLQALREDWGGVELSRKQLRERAAADASAEAGT